MKNNKNRKRMTEEEVLQDPSLSHFHEAIRFLKDKPNKDIFPKQYETAIIDVSMQRLTEHFEKQPNVSFKTLLARVLTQLPADVTPLLLSKVVKEATEVWEELVTSTQKENQTLTAA